MSAVELPRDHRWSPAGWIAPRRLVPVMLVAALFALGPAWKVLGPRLNPAVTTLDVSGNFTHLTPRRIAAAAAVVPGTRWLDADLTAIRDRVAALPWVATVAVHRRWPDALVLRVTERLPVARWNAGSLLDASGQPFTPSPAALRQPTLADLARLSGPPERAAAVLGAWRLLRPALSGTPLVPVALSLDARGEWRARTAGGIRIRFGPVDPVTDTSLLRRVVVPTLAPRLAEVAVIDLRYGNGFAVAWRSGAAPPDLDTGTDQ